MSAIKLEKPINVNKLPGWAEGFVSVQDAASQYVVKLLDLEPNLTLLDACAAPGGKTSAILEAEPSLKIIAVDKNVERIKLIKDNLERLGLSADLEVADVAEPLSWEEARVFSRILIDAPCSATGVIRRHPDIKFLRKTTDISNLAATQLQILKNLWPKLAPNGILLYCTCSILPAENDQVIARFLQSVATAKVLPIKLATGYKQTYGWQILPGDAAADGFYYCKIQKT